MNRRTRTVVQSATQVVSRLVELCHKGGPLYRQSPQAVAQVCRTAKWLLNALARLEQARSIPSNNPSWV
jgi:hypothetical protein